MGEYVRSSLRQDCPRCGDVMKAMYHPVGYRSDEWRYVWYCEGCRNVVAISDATSEFHPHALY